MSRMTDKRGGVRFIDAGERQCRYFINNESGMNGLVCADATMEGSSYCPQHHRVLFKPVLPISWRRRFEDGEIGESAGHGSDLSEFLS